MSGMYFKFKNSYNPKNGTWWLYSKIIRHNGDKETCQVFEFEKTSRDNHFIAGMAQPFVGRIDTNRYKYYCDMHEECSKEEFENELKAFMEDFNAYVEFIRFSP